jgi:peptide/nickel transport system substrate-binding protein
VSGRHATLGWAALLTIALVASGCSDDAMLTSNANQGGSVVVAEAEAPDSLDPALASSPAARRAAWLAYTPPITYRRAEGQAGTELVAALAEELPETSDDGRTYTFTFEAGLRYSNGQVLRASDFERALARSLRLDPDAIGTLGGIVGASAYAHSRGDATDIRGVITDDAARTVRIELTTADRLFVYALATTWAAPVPRGTPVEDLSADPPPGVGPYRVAQVRRGGDVVLERRQSWRLAAVPAGNPREIVTRTIADLDERVRAVRTGQADLVEGESPVQLLPDIRSAADDSYEEHRTLRTLYVSIDASRAPFRDGDVRRAVSYSLDVADLARLFGGFMQPSCNAIPPEVPGHAALDPCPFGDRAGDTDLVKASQLVEDAGARGEPVGVAAGTDSRGRALTSWLVRTLRKIGLAARAVPADRAQVAFAAADPPIPHPAPYLDSVDDPVLRAQVELLGQEDDPRDSAREWADVDEDAVSRAYLAPFGVATAGVLSSERLDMGNCSRFHPVVGMDYSSVCLR